MAAQSRRSKARGSSFHPPPLPSERDIESGGASSELLAQGVTGGLLEGPPAGRGGKRTGNGSSTFSEGRGGTSSATQESVVFARGSELKLHRDPAVPSLLAGHARCTIGLNSPAMTLPEGLARASF